MMRSALGAALVMYLTAPVVASAQLVTVAPDLPNPRLRITPFIGHLGAFTRHEDWGRPSDGDFSYRRVETSLAGGTAAGLVIETPLAGSVGITVAGAFAQRGATRHVVVQTGERSSSEGSDNVFGRAGLSVQLPRETSDLVLRQITAAVFAAGAVMYERPRGPTADPSQGVMHFGGAAGFTAERSFAGRLAVQIGIEDHIMVWNQRALARPAFEYYGRPGGSLDLTPVRTGLSHAWLLRAGLGLRL
jgi:hypothetical protein